MDGTQPGSNLSGGGTSLGGAMMSPTPSDVPASINGAVSRSPHPRANNNTLMGIV